MIQRGLSSGMTQVSVRKVEANNKYMTDSYDNEKESSYILYLDANNLYGWAMSMKLPYTNIKFIQHTDINEEDILSYDNIFPVPQTCTTNQALCHMSNIVSRQIESVESICDS